MSNRSLENMRVMRTAAWTWLVYLVSMAVLDLIIYNGKPNNDVLWYHLYNWLPALVFIGLAYSNLLKNYDRFVSPLMILIISGAPILITHLLGLRLPPAPLSNLEGMVLRQLPVLFIGLVLVAWHYRLLTMILYSVGTNLFDLGMFYAVDRLDGSRLLTLYFITIIRTVCFVVVGLFINQLINYLRSQQDSLQVANNQLTHYASTLESLTVSRERNRMSREMHDTVVHTLSGLSVQLETTKAYFSVDPGTARNLIDQSIEATRAGLQETRRALKALRASPLEDLGLLIALRQLFEKAAERGKLQLDVRLPEKELLLSPDVEQCIYRIAQEAAENVVHHANAQCLTVKLAMDADEIQLEIQDDGIGFHPENHAPSGHFGLKGMQERAQLVGGVLTIDSQPSNPKPGFTARGSSGTTIRLVIKGRYL